MLPTLYQHYTTGGISSGLTSNISEFLLNNRPFTIFSGSMHYFRVHPDYWRDRLKKMKAAGLNTVDTYIPWNLHEPSPGEYDFGNGGSDFQQFLNLRKFLKTAQEEDLFAIVRPGPFICGEFEFGGLPSWLLREEGIKLRSKDNKFLNHVERYFSVLLPILAMLQFTRGGPIIGFQIENEYGAFRNRPKYPGDMLYLMELHKFFIENGINQLLLISENPNSDHVIVPGILLSFNFHDNVDEYLAKLHALQPDKPLLVMEFWTGWFDQWGQRHNKKDVTSLSLALANILRHECSVNLYMFHGGTTYGFLNGALYESYEYSPIINSYDYDAPITESGDYTEKYFYISMIIKNFSKIETLQPKPPEMKPKTAYPPAKITKELKLMDILDKQCHSFKYKHGVVPMEFLPVNNNSGQSYGYIAYRKTKLRIPPNSKIEFFAYVRDAAMFLINGELVTAYSLDQDSKQKTRGILLTKNISYADATLDIIIENMGRVNFFGEEIVPDQYKGLCEGNITLNGELLLDWQIFPLEFKKNWTENLNFWSSPNFTKGPTLYMATFDVLDMLDTFVDMRSWGRGIIIINGFVLSRYNVIGPQQTAYLPAPFLRKGTNTLIIFEHQEPGTMVYFTTGPVYGKPTSDIVDPPSIDLDAIRKRVHAILRKNSSNRSLLVSYLLILFTVIMTTKHLLCTTITS